MTEAPSGIMVHIGRRGWTVTMPNQHRPDGSVSSTGTISGYGDGWQEHVEPGTPVVDTRSIPEDKILKWALQSPMVNPDLEGVRGRQGGAGLRGSGREPRFRHGGHDAPLDEETGPCKQYGLCLGRGVLPARRGVGRNRLRAPASGANGGVI